MLSILKTNLLPVPQNNEFIDLLSDSHLSGSSVGANHTAQKISSILQDTSTFTGSSKSGLIFSAKGTPTKDIVVFAAKQRKHVAKPRLLNI